MSCPFCQKKKEVTSPRYVRGCNCESRIKKGLPVQRFTGKITDCDGGFLIKLRQPFVLSDCFGDMLSMDVETQSLFVANHFSLDDLDIGYNYHNSDVKFDDDERETREEMDAFFTANFISRDYARGFVRRILINNTRD